MNKNISYVAVIVLIGAIVFYLFQKNRLDSAAIKKPVVATVVKPAPEKPPVAEVPKPTPVNPPTAVAPPPPAEPPKPEPAPPAPVAKPKPEQEIKMELQNPKSGEGPAVAIGSTVKLEYKILEAKTGKVIAESGKSGLPTNFEIGKPNVFGNLLMNIVGSHKGAKFKVTLPPEFGVLTPQGSEFAKSHSISPDTVLMIDFSTVEVIPKK